MATRPEPLPKDDWMFAFAMELVRVRRGMPYSEAEALAKAQWQTRGRTGPEEAARRWLGENKPPGGR